MVHIILVLTGYLNTILAAVYCLTCYQVFSDSSEKRLKRRYRRQEHILLYFQFFANLDLVLLQKDIRLVYFYLAQLVFVLFVLLFYRRIYPGTSRLLTNNMMFFMVVGMIMLTRLSYENYALKQFIMIVASFFLCMLLPLMMKRIRMWEKLTWFYGVSGFIVLATVLVFGVSKYGASNWISIAGITLQPSEFAKILFVLFLACRLSKPLDLKQLVITTAIAGAYVLFLVLEKDLGAALIFFIVYLVMLYVATGRLTLFISGVLAGSAAAVVAYRLFNHVQTRVNIWRDPWGNIDNGSYQVIQSLFAIGTGSWFGLGLGQGMPDSIPVVYSDFIFSALAEEMGTIFVLCLILVYVSCLLVFLNASMSSRYPMYKLIALGFGVCFMFQIFLNIGGAVKFIPLTGVTLPLISYGRSSVVSVLLIFGITQGLVMLGEKKEDGKEYEEKSEEQAGEYGKAGEKEREVRQR